jgi:hypothetical protein
MSESVDEKMGNTHPLTNSYTHTSCGDIIPTIGTSLKSSSRNEYSNIREVKRTFRTRPAI